MSSSSQKQDDPVIFYSKDRIGNISKDVFANDDFKQANKTNVDDSKRRTGEQKQSWTHIWKSASSGKPGPGAGGGDGNTNAFRFNSA